MRCVRKVYTDGACKNNGRKNAKAGIGVYWGEISPSSSLPDHPLNVSEQIFDHVTNNGAEIMAALVAITQAVAHGLDVVHIVTDSIYLFNAMTRHICMWRKNNWCLLSNPSNNKKTEIKNKILFQIMYKIIKKNKIRVVWEHCRGHAGVEGNEAADMLATKSI